MLNLKKSYTSVEAGYYSSMDSGNDDIAGQGKLSDYLRRLTDIRQMDFEATYEQFMDLLSTEPARVYIPFFSRKQHKKHWARDDPAFVVVELVFLAIASLAYAIAFRRASFWSYIWTVLYSIIVDYFFVGIAVASTGSYIANKYLRQQNHSHSVAQEVEWLYAFDVHTNSFFCSFLVTYVLQYFLLPILLGRNFVSCILSNTLYSIAMIWYAYNTHLGYRQLPFLGNTQVFLWYPIVTVVLLLALSILLLLLGFRINCTRICMAFHYGLA